MYKRRFSNWLAGQRGFFSAELSMALAVAAIAAVAATWAVRQAADADAAGLQADALMAVRGAAHKLVMQNYAAYQADEPITRNGVTLAPGDGAGQSRRPTVANLRSMSLGIDGALDNGIYKSLTTASYDITMTRSPLCSTAPGSADCHVTGLVCLNAPIRDQWAAVGEVDGPGQGIMLTRMGGTGATSLLGAAENILAADGSWSLPNPYGAVAGIVCARFGWGSEGDDYLRVADTRDPNFKGPLTVSGAVTTNSTVTAASDITSAGLLKGAQLVPTSVQPLGGACANDGAVAKTAGGLLWCNGGVWRDLVSIAADGVACAVEGQPARDSSGVQLLCVGGKYRQVSKFVRDAVAGASCSPRGVIAYDFSAATPSALLCRANAASGVARWIALEAVTSSLIFAGSVGVSDGSTVAAPVCSAIDGVAANPLIYLLPQTWAKSTTTTADPAPAGGFSALSSITINEGMTFGASGSGPWSISIKAADGASADSASAVAQTYCHYQ